MLAPNYVLGSSLTGLVVAHILGWPCIGGDLGGRANVPFQLGPQILDYCSDSLWLLETLGLELQQPTDFKVGYFYKNCLHLEPSGEMLAEYYNKTRGGNYPTTSAMSGGKSKIYGWDILGQIKTILKKRVPILDIPIGKISDGCIFSNSVPIYFNQLISTIPYPIYAKLAGYRLPTTEALPTTFILAGHSSGLKTPISLDDYDLAYVYIIDEEIPFHRLTRVYDQFVLEIRGDKSYSKKDLIWLGLTEIESYIVSDCQMVSKTGVYDKYSIPGIRPIGRYAEWDHSIKIKDVIRGARKYAGTLGREGE